MHFGAGALRGVGELARANGIHRPVVVSDRTLRECGILDRVLAALADQDLHVTTFEGVTSNPREEDVAAALKVFEESESDGVVAVGGGSPIDCAKALRLLATHDGTITDYDLLLGGADRITAPLPPLISVPTTAGTGSEVSRGALIVTRRGDIVRKTVVASSRLVSTAVILDSELTVGLPPALTAGTGMDALSHCIEEYLSPRYHPVVAALALDAAGTISRVLPAVWDDPANVEARGEMLMASMMAGIGFEKGLGVIHALSHAIGALRPIHHGTINAVLLPYSIDFNRDHCRPGVLEELANRVGLSPAGDSDAADRLIDWLRKLNDGLEIPARLGDLGDLAADRDEIIDRALEDHCHRTNPRKCGREDFLELWERAV